MPERIDVRVLGAVELDRNGAPLALRGSKVRGLLSLLLLRRGSVVPADTLIEALWGEDAPLTARNALQVHVSTLRKLLAPDPRIRVEHRGTGYHLACEDDQVDLFRFRRLAEEAADAAGRGETERAHELIGRALALWRGHPFEDLDIPGLPMAPIADIVEERAAALALRFELDLALGRHEEVVRGIGSVRAERPYDERLVAIAALALYRSGRQADALAVLAELRRSLAEELGIEPGPAIAQLERRILAHDPAIGPPEAEPAVPEHRLRRIVTALICRLDQPHGAVPDPEAERRDLAAAVDLARQVLDAHGGRIGEVVGGGRVTAIFGLTHAHEDDPVRAVRAASEIVTGLAEVVPADRRVQVRIGIATGEVLVRTSGNERSLLSADPLDVADRLAAAARAGEILVSPATWTLARTAAEMEPARIIHIPDDAPPISAYRLVREPAVGHGRRASSAAFVGRRHDLAVLSEIVERTMRERTASLVTILGPAGIGKSRLVTELLDRHRERTGVLIGRCLPYGRDITFWPVIEIVRAAAGLELGTPGRQVERRIARVLRDAGEVDPGFVVDQLLGLLGLTAPSTAPEDIAWALRRFLIAAARDRQILVVFEDLHWAEDTLLDLIEHLVAPASDTALLVIATARPELLERRTTWGAGLDATNLTLGPLDETASAQLLDELLGRHTLEPAVRTRIAEVAEGNPLFLEELVSMLIADGRLRWEEGRWTAAGDLHELGIPLTIQSLIEARLDRLPPRERATLERAAVIGRVFSEDELTALGEDAAAADLDALARRDLIVLERSSREGRTFRFRHILIREVAYRSASKRLRADAHAAMGTHLERRAGSRMAEIDELIAYHLESAVRYRRELGHPDDPAIVTRAVEHLAAAGRRAFSRGDMPAAAGLLGRALSLVGERDPRGPELSWKRAVALIDMGRFEEAAHELDHGEMAARRQGDVAWSWRLRMERAELGFWREPTEHDSRHLEAVASEALRVLESVGDHAGMARACRLMGQALASLGRYEEAMPWFDEARRHAEAGGEDLELRVGTTAGVHGPLPAERCIELLRATLQRDGRPDPDGLAALGLVLTMTGDREGARATFEEGLARAAELGVRWKAANVLMHRGAALLIEDDPAGAVAVLREAVSNLREMGERGMLPTAVAMLAEALYRLGRNEEAMEATIESEATTAPDDVASQVAWRAVRAKLLVRQGRPHEGLRLAREAAERADRTDSLQMAGDAHADLAEVLLAAGASAEAAREMEQAVRLYERKGNILSAQRARARLAQLRRVVRA